LIKKTNLYEEITNLYEEIDIIKENNHKLYIETYQFDLINQGLMDEYKILEKNLENIKSQTSVDKPHVDKPHVDKPPDDRANINNSNNRSSKSKNESNAGLIHETMGSLAVEANKIQDNREAILTRIDKNNNIITEKEMEIIKIEEEIKGINLEIIRININAKRTTNQTNAKKVQLDQDLKKCKELNKTYISDFTLMNTKINEVIELNLQLEGEKEKLKQINGSNNNNNN
jgi:hypothetical protein